MRFTPGGVCIEGDTPSLAAAGVQSACAATGFTAAGWTMNRKAASETAVASDRLGSDHMLNLRVVLERDV
jgi:hypothetical protein